MSSPRAEPVTHPTSNLNHEHAMHQIAVIDDYQNVAQNYGDWAALRPVAQVTVFNDHLSEEDALAKRLQPFDVLCVMRERTPLRRSLLERLARLRMIATTG